MDNDNPKKQSNTRNKNIKKNALKLIDIVKNIFWWVHASGRGCPARNTLYSFSIYLWNYYITFNISTFLYLFKF